MVRPDAAMKRVFSILLSVLIAAQTAPGFDYPLSSEAIREAYFLGKESADRRDGFLQPYRHRLPLPESGPQVGLIEVETPFTFIVDRVSRQASGYYAQDAEQDYLGKSGHFRVHVEIDFTATYPEAYDTAASLGKFWEDFKVHLKQKSEIAPLRVAGRPIYNNATVSGYSGATIDVDYDVMKIDRGAPTRIIVDPPEGEPVETTFDLAKLR